MTNVDLTKQILVKVSETLDKAIEQACVEHRKRTGENISKPEKVREIVYSALVIGEYNMKEEFQKAARVARLGELPKFINDECLAKAKEGNTSHIVNIHLLDLRKKVGSVYLKQLEECWAWDVNAGGAPNWHKLPSVIVSIVSDLRTETGLQIQPFSFEKEARIELQISWSDKTE